MKTDHVIAIIQARMASSRLPGKVLLDIGGQPMLARVVERVKRARTVERVVVATTTDPSDDPVERLCQERGYPCYRGSAQDVLDRYYQAARLFGAEIVVRITADCPAVDPGLIDETVKALYEPSTVSRQSALVGCQGRQPSTTSTLQPSTTSPPTVCPHPGGGPTPSGWMWRSAPSREWRQPGRKPANPTSAST